MENLIEINSIESELDLERAIQLRRKLKALNRSKDREIDYTDQIKYLGQLIVSYEDKMWTAESNVTDNQIKESDEAELILNKELEFINKRKELIKSQLKCMGAKQKDLVPILGRSASYISEIINGARSINAQDAVLLSKILNVSIDDLVYCTFETIGIDNLRAEKEKKNTLAEFLIKNSITQEFTKGGEIKVKPIYNVPSNKLDDNKHLNT